MKKTFKYTVMVVAAVVVSTLTMSAIPAGSVSDSGCVNYYLTAYDDGDVVATMNLTSSCTYLFIDKSEHPHTRTQGTYSMSRPLERGSSCQLTLYVDGEYAGSATLAWPTEEGVCMFMNGYTFK